MRFSPVSVEARDIRRVGQFGSRLESLQEARETSAVFHMTGLRGLSAHMRRPRRTSSPTGRATAETGPARRCVLMTDAIDGESAVRQGGD
jgi:hypothetical protein